MPGRVSSRVGILPPCGAAVKQAHRSGPPVDPADAGKRKRWQAADRRHSSSSHTPAPMRLERTMREHAGSPTAIASPGAPQILPVSGSVPPGLPSRFPGPMPVGFAFPTGTGLPPLSLLAGPEPEGLGSIGRADRSTVRQCIATGPGKTDGATVMTRSAPGSSFVKVPRDPGHWIRRQARRSLCRAVAARDAKAPFCAVPARSVRTLAQRPVLYVNPAREPHRTSGSQTERLDRFQGTRGTSPVGRRPWHVRRR